MSGMTLKEFRRLGKRDFENGAVLDAIEETIEERDRLHTVVWNALTTLGVMSLPRRDENVADNATLLRILTTALQNAVGYEEVRR